VYYENKYMSLSAIENKKYPRTYHVPFSPGTTSDDRLLHDGWFEDYQGKEIVLTEKLDGENQSCTNQDVYARSHAAPTRSDWSVNMWGPSGLFWTIKNFIADDELIYGENLYGIHSIEYNRLTNYYHLFAVRNETRWYSWDEVTEFASLLQIPTVPILWRGIAESEEQIKGLILDQMKLPSTYGTEKEGVVMRTVRGFDILSPDGVENFPHHVCKYVRPHHVRTDVFWARNWRRAKLIYEQYN
jgi:hypothetical protein